jgi:Fe-S cluster assembly iron-binding protein IscA
MWGMFRRDSMEVKVTAAAANQLKRLIKEKDNPDIGAKIYIAGHG